VTVLFISSDIPTELTRSVGGTEILTGLPFASNPLKSLNIESFPDMSGARYATDVSYTASQAFFN
jgi:hypothetical protein